MPQEARAEVAELLAALRHAELVDIKWGARGMLCGWPISTPPTVLEVKVTEEAAAWAINRAKEALSAGDERAAAAILSKIEFSRAHW